MIAAMTIRRRMAGTVTSSSGPSFDDGTNNANDDVSKKFKNVGSFCEAAALVAGGSAFKIICERKISSDGLATIAIAEMDGV